MKIEIIHDAMDKSFRFTGDQWPKDFHECLNLPGIFKKLLQNDTVKDPKTGIRMDILELVEVKGEVEIIINVEHQSTIVDSVKIKIIDDYKNHSKCKYKLPLLTIIVSPFPKEQHVNEYKSTDSDILQPIFVTIDEKEIEKRLNILKSNINNKNIKNSVILNIAIISIFVLKNEYEILKKLCIILKESIGITGKIKQDMTKVLEEMIKYKLQKHPKQTQELLNMLNEEIEITKRGIRIWYEEEFEELEKKHELEILEKDKIIAQKEQDHANQLQEKEQEHTNQLIEKEKEHTKQLLKKEQEHTNQLIEKDKIIADLKSKLELNSI